MEQFKRAQVIMLFTNYRSNIIQSLDKSQLMYLSKALKETNNVELYIISDDKIKENNWCIETNKDSNDFNKIFKAHNNENKGYIHSVEACNNYNSIKKIIATTNSSLNELSRFNKKSWEDLLPQSSQQFIEKYIESYNKGEIITDVLVEYEKYMNNKSQARQNVSESGLIVNDVKLKVNPKDNTITIKKVKDNWNRNEHINNINKYRYALLTEISKCLKADLILTEEFTNKWIEDNL